MRGRDVRCKCSTLVQLGTSAACESHSDRKKLLTRECLFVVLVMLHYVSLNRSIVKIKDRLFMFISMLCLYKHN